MSQSPPCARTSARSSTSGIRRATGPTRCRRAWSDAPPDGSSILASYTHSHVRDVQTPLRTGVPGVVNWSSKAVAGRHDHPTAGISLNDVPHRVVLAGTFKAPWHAWSTEVSFYYVGESGSPFTYVAWGTGLRGDLNADGSAANDPIYVPRDAFDPAEIRISGEAPDGDNSAAAVAEREFRQREALERLVERTPCLRRQRGRILERNSCREPWSHTTVAAVRQTIPVAGHGFEADLQVFNVLNLLRRDWGLTRLASPKLLEHVAHTAGTLEEAQPIFRFDTTTAQWVTSPDESAFHLQVALRYRF